MATTVKITTIGNSVGIILPRETLAKLKVAKGDSLFLSDAPCGIQLTPYDAAMERKLDVLDDVMRENRDVLRQLAK